MMSPFLLPWKLDDEGWRFGSWGITQVLSHFFNLGISEPKPAIGRSSSGCTVVTRFDRFHHLRFCVVTGAGGGYQWNGGSHWIWTMAVSISTWETLNSYLGVTIDAFFDIYHCYKIHQLASFACFELNARRAAEAAMCWDTKRQYH